MPRRAAAPPSPLLARDSFAPRFIHCASSEIEALTAAARARPPAAPPCAAQLPDARNCQGGTLDCPGDDLAGMFDWLPDPGAAWRAYREGSVDARIVKMADLSRFRPVETVSPPDGSPFVPGDIDSWSQAPPELSPTSSVDSMGSCVSPIMFAQPCGRISGADVDFWFPELQEPASGRPGGGAAPRGLAGSPVRADSSATEYLEQLQASEAASRAYSAAQDEATVALEAALGASQQSEREARRSLDRARRELDGLRRQLERKPAAELELDDLRRQLEASREVNEKLAASYQDVCAQLTAGLRSARRRGPTTAKLEDRVERSVAGLELLAEKMAKLEQHCARLEEELAKERQVSRMADLNERVEQNVVETELLAEKVAKQHRACQRMVRQTARANIRVRAREHELDAREARGVENSRVSRAKFEAASLTAKAAAARARTAEEILNAASALHASSVKHAKKDAADLQDQAAKVARMIDEAVP